MNSIRIPVTYGINNHTYAEVTPDLARQIVALGHMAQTESMIQQYQIPGMPPGMITIDAGLKAPLNAMENVPAEPFLGEAHQTALEKAHRDDVMEAADVDELDCIALNVAEYRKDGNTKWLTTIECHAKTVKREIADLRARVSELEKELATAVDGRAMHLKSHNKAVAERDRALTDLAAEREHVCALVATSVEQETRIAVERERREKAEKERDAARAEVERLKARKVKLPAKQAGRGPLGCDELLDSTPIREK